MNKKVTTRLGIGIISILSIVLSLLIFMASKNIDRQVVDVAVYQNQLVTQDNTTDWNTYRNDDFGFEFKYPKDWIIKNNSGVNADPSIVSIVSQETKNETEAGTMCCGPDISFYYYSSIENQPDNKDIKANNLDEFIEKDSFTEKTGERMVGDINMIETIQGGAGAYYVLMKENNSHIYKIFFTHKDSRGKLSNIENMILSTYKITK